MVRPVIRVPFTEGIPRVPSGSTFDQARSSLMSKVPSLLFEMEDAEENPSSIDALSGPPEGDVIARLHTLLDPWTDQEYMLNLHVRIATDEATKRGEQHLAVPQLADTLRKLGHPVKLRTALGGGWGGACLRNLRHSFLAVTMASSTPSSVPAATVLVDPRFREQFEIAHPTPRYVRILAEIPVALVAPAERLSKAVELLCAEMAVAFATMGTPVPPWRQPAAMLSKWQPRRSEEVDVSRGVHNMDAAALNNAMGGHGHGHYPHNKLTGGNTVAQKLAMLGVEPAVASPISEGLEDLACWSTGTDEEDTPIAPSSPNDIVCPSLTPENDGQATVFLAEGKNTGSGPAQAIDCSGAVWDGIREANAAASTQPARRSTWH